MTLLAHTIHGEIDRMRPPVLLVHGLFGSQRNWGLIVKRLTATHCAITADLRNHGDSPWCEDMSYGALAADISALITRLGCGPVDLLGHSMGGKAAMMLALTAPDQVNRLLISDIAPIRYRSGFDRLVTAMQAVDLTTIDRRTTADSALAGAVPDGRLRAFLLQNLLVENGVARWRINLAALKNGLAEIACWQDPDPLVAFEKPTLFTAGANSDYITSDARADIKRRFPKSRVSTLKNAGHWLHAEQPAAFLATLQAFFAPSSANG